MPKETCFKPYTPTPADLIGHIIIHPTRGTGLITGASLDCGIGEWIILWSDPAISEALPDSVIWESRVMTVGEAVQVPF